MCIVFPITTIKKTIQRNTPQNTIKKLKCNSKKCASNPYVVKKGETKETVNK